VGGKMYIGKLSGYFIEQIQQFGSIKTNTEQIEMIARIASMPQ
jgi:hypothetical protein